MMSTSNTPSWTHDCAQLNQRNVLDFDIEPGQPIREGDDLSKEFVCRFQSVDRSLLSPREDPVAVGEIAVPISVTTELDNATVPQTLGDTRRKLLKFDKIELPSDVQIPDSMHAQIRDLLQKIPPNQWEHIQGSGKKRMQIRDFMSNDQKAVSKLRELLKVDYIPGLLVYAQSMYSTLSYFEFNILSTEEGETVDQGIHVDLKNGNYGLSLIAAIDPFRFFYCKEGTKEYVDVNVGECVMFSGECVHGGAATNYLEKTYRLFVCFVQTKNHLPGKNTYFPSEDHPDVPSDYKRPGSNSKRRRNEIL